MGSFSLWQFGEKENDDYMKQRDNIGQGVPSSFVPRTTLRRDAPQPEFELLQPINLELRVKRNLGASWFTEIPGVEVKGVLRSMNVSSFRFISNTLNLFIFFYL